MADDETMKVDQRLTRLEGTVANEFYEIKKRFGSIDARFDAVDGRLDKVDGRLDRVDKRLDRLEVAFKVHDDKMTAGFRDIAERIDRLASRRGRRVKRQ